MNYIQRLLLKKEFKKIRKEKEKIKKSSSYSPTKVDRKEREKAKKTMERIGLKNKKEHYRILQLKQLGITEPKKCRCPERMERKKNGVRLYQGVKPYRIKKVSNEQPIKQCKLCNNTHQDDLIEQGDKTYLCIKCVKKEGE